MHDNIILYLFYKKKLYIYYIDILQINVCIIFHNKSTSIKNKVPGYNGWPRAPLHLTAALERGHEPPMLSFPLEYATAHR